MALSRHDQAQELSARAELARRTGDRATARRLFREAADLEGAALQALPSDRRRSRGILAVSYVALLFKSADYDRAESEICTLIAGGFEARHHEQLRELL